MVNEVAGSALVTCHLVSLYGKTFQGVGRLSTC